jgi:flavin reductase (DIM6/NTAB) family NADH-FMN oxidoreductase RutF
MTKADVAQTFSTLVGELEAPTSIVTVQAGGERAGCLVGFATQTSIDPPRYLVCLSRRNHTYHTAVRHRARVLAVHFPGEDDHDLAELFGGQTGDDVDKFEASEWHDGPEGAPILDACENWFVGHVIGQLPLGDHVGFLLEPIAARHAAGGRGVLTLQDVADIEPGHQP